MKNILVLSAACSAIASASYAQTNIASDRLNDEIIVRAQKRDQSITDVPAAISALGQDDLDALGVQQFDDLADFIPGLEVQEQSANNPGFVIRGLTSDSGDPTTEPRVSIFQDGVPNSRSRGSFVEVFDTQVEVLRGPQPTLFGRSAQIGAISLNSIKPDPDAPVEGNLRAGYGNLDFTLVEGAVNLPVNETLAFRLAGRWKQRDGYIESLTDQEDYQGFQVGALRASALWKPTEKLEALYIFNIQRDQNTGTSFKSGTFLSEGADIAPSSPTALNFFGGPFSEGKTELGLDRVLWNATLRLDYQINDYLSVTSISGYREFDSDEVFDPDGFDYPAIQAAEDAEGDQFSQEIRLNFNDGGRWAGFAGFSYFDEQGEQRVPTRFTQALAAGFLNNNPFTGNPLIFSDEPGVVQSPVPVDTINNLVGLFFTIPPEQIIFDEEFINISDQQSYEFFADATYQLTDTIDVTGGFRYTRDEKRSGFTAFLPGGQASVLTGGGLGLGAQVLTNDGAGLRSEDQAIFTDGSFEGWTGRFAVNYDITPDLTLFANYGRGRRPDVISFDQRTGQVGLSQDQFEVIPAETVNSFELGGKGRFFDGRLQSDASIYYYDYNNFQTSVVDGVNEIRPVNAGSATALGIEGTLSYTVTEWLALFGNYAWNDATFDDEDGNGEPQEFGGNRFRLSPEHALTLGAQGTWEADCGVFQVRPLFTYRSEIFFDDDNDRPDLQGSIDPLANERQAPFGVLDLRATWTSVDGRYRVELFGENILDRDYILDAGNTGDGLGSPTFIAAAPATYGGYLSVNF